MDRLRIQDVNSLDYEDFIQRFGNVVEHCQLAAAAVWSSRPFSSVDDLQTALEKFMDNLPMNGKEGILRCHPDLAGRLAAVGKLTSESTSEQKAAGLHDLTTIERTKLNTMNQEYKIKFGFPFVICARENKKEAILQGLERRLENTMEVETLAGVDEVKKICYLRLLDIVEKSYDGAKL